MYKHGRRRPGFPGIGWGIAEALPPATLACASRFHIALWPRTFRIASEHDGAQRHYACESAGSIPHSEGKFALLGSGLPIW